jgi:hypothetical protein
MEKGLLFLVIVTCNKNFRKKKFTLIHLWNMQMFEKCVNPLDKVRVKSKEINIWVECLFSSVKASF